MQKLLSSMRVFAILAILFGLIYPFFIFGVSNILFPYQANGSLIKRGSIVVGSALIAQKFTSPKYFHNRFSFFDYHGSISGGSNLAPFSNKLIEQTKDHIEYIRSTNYVSRRFDFPADMVLNSSSGLDPHISLANANIQLLRVAEYRSLSKDKIKKLIRDNIDPDFVGIWGQAGVNVLKLNLSLDKDDS